jgi:hypothetical protein
MSPILTNRQLLINKLALDGINLRGKKLDKHIKSINNFKMSLNDRILKCIQDKEQYAILLNNIKN